MLHSNKLDADPVIPPVKNVRVHLFHPTLTARMGLSYFLEQQQSEDFVDESLPSIFQIFRSSS